jgi:hypothetical protein
MPVALNIDIGRTVEKLFPAADFCLVGKEYWQDKSLLIDPSKYECQPFKYVVLVFSIADYDLHCDRIKSCLTDFTEVDKSDAEITIMTRSLTSGYCQHLARLAEESPSNAVNQCCP